MLERLPFKPTDAVARELRELRAAANAAPLDPAPAARLARRYFRLAMAEGDPRYVGYGEAVLARWWTAADAPVEVLIARALLKQYKHDFESALADFGAAGRQDPGREVIWSWRAALHIVRAEYAEAAKDCEPLQSISVASRAACQAWIDGINGKAAMAYESMQAAFAQDADASPSERIWTLTRLAELALRLGEPQRAERHFRAALAAGEDDQYLLGAYADFLLDEGRPAEVLPMLSKWRRSDVLLLRLAIAAKLIGSPDAKTYADDMQARFAAAALRGDKLHLQEEARFALEVRGDAASALRIATENYTTQREPRDARILLEAAVATRDAAAAQPALDWLAATHHEDPLLRRLAAKLTGQASSR